MRRFGMIVLGLALLIFAVWILELWLEQQRWVGTKMDEGMRRRSASEREKKRMIEDAMGQRREDEEREQRANDRPIPLLKETESKESVPIRRPAASPPHPVRHLRP